LDPAAEREVRTRLAAGLRLEAFELLLPAFRDKVLRLAWSILGDHSLAEDAAQEAFIRIWKALPGFRGASSLSTWIYSIARNAALTALQRKGSSSLLSLADRNAAIAADAHAAGQERTDHSPDVLRFLLALPQNQRQVLALYYIEERSYEEVARILDMPLGTVKTYMHRGRKALAEAVLESRRAELAERRRS